MRPLAGDRRANTLVELVVSLGLMAVATVAVLDLMAMLFGTTAARMRRTDEMAQTLRLLERLTVDAEAATVTEDGPRTFTSHRTAVLPVRDRSENRLPRPVTYRFDDSTHVFERGEPVRGYTKIARFEVATVRFDVRPLSTESDPARVFSCRVVSQGVGNAGRSGPPGQGTTRPIDVFATRVITPPSWGQAPQGWLEPGLETR